MDRINKGDCFDSPLSVSKNLLTRCCRLPKRMSEAGFSDPEAAANFRHIFKETDVFSSVSTYKCYVIKDCRKWSGVFFDSLRGLF